MEITKKIEINENVLTLYNFINIMYYNTRCNLPDEIVEEIESLLTKMTEYLEKDFLDLDIVKNKLMREVTFIDKK